MLLGVACAYLVAGTAALLVFTFASGAPFKWSSHSRPWSVFEMAALVAMWFVVARAPAAAAEALVLTILIKRMAKPAFLLVAGTFVPVACEVAMTYPATRRAWLRMVSRHLVPVFLAGFVTAWWAVRLRHRHEAWTAPPEDMDRALVRRLGSGVMPVLPVSERAIVLRVAATSLVILGLLGLAAHELPRSWTSGRDLFPRIESIVVLAMGLPCALAAWRASVRARREPPIS